MEKCILLDTALSCPVHTSHGCRRVSNWNAIHVLAQFALEHRRCGVSVALEFPIDHVLQGDQVYLARVDPLIETINNGSAYEFYAGGSGGNASWVNGISNAQPLFTWENHTGVVTMSYHPALQKYIMVVGTPTDSPSMVGPFDVYFLESDNITGPWSYISYLSQFGPEAYFVHFPSKFLASSLYKSPATRTKYRHQSLKSADLKARSRAPTKKPCGMAAAVTATSRATAQSVCTYQHTIDDLTSEWCDVDATTVPISNEIGASLQLYYNAFLSYSANFAYSGSGANPPGSGYHWSLQSVRMSLAAGIDSIVASQFVPVTEAFATASP
jgi:hypothetical protein